MFLSFVLCYSALVLITSRIDGGFGASSTFSTTRARSIGSPSGRLVDACHRLRRKKPWRDGTTHIRMAAAEFVLRLLALIPAPHRQGRRA